jgi:hypothetical protein
MKIAVHRVAYLAFTAAILATPHVASYSTFAFKKVADQNIACIRDSCEFDRPCFKQKGELSPFFQQGYKQLFCKVAKKHLKASKTGIAISVYILLADLYRNDCHVNKFNIGRAKWLHLNLRPSETNVILIAINIAIGYFIYTASLYESALVLGANRMLNPASASRF